MNDEDARRRAVALGDAGNLQAIDELLHLTHHRRPMVRRAAVSALGKLTEAGSIAAAIPRLSDLTRDPHPQVRQYALKTLGRTGDESVLPVLRDAAHRATEPGYNLRSALTAIDAVEKAVADRQGMGTAACSRCGRGTTPEERRMSETQFQRIFCDACFNAVFIERRNFDMKVQNQKTILTANRTVVQSKGERQIADWLTARSIDFRYDDKFQIIQGYAIRPDFYLPLYDAYIEYWGLDTTDYIIGMQLKKKLYQQEGKKLISLYPPDLPRLDDRLGQALAQLGRPAIA